MMGRQRLLQCYFDYALLLGVTSYRQVAGKARQTWLTRVYTLVLNVLSITTLPMMIYISIAYIEKNNQMISLLILTSCILYTISYATIFYTIISRGKRDLALLQLERTVGRIMQQQVHEVSQQLNRLYYLKLGSVVLVCVNSMALAFLVPDAEHWSVFLVSYVFQNAMNIPTVATYRYFLSLWQIARVYQSINDRLDQLMQHFRHRLPTQLELRELQRLWSHHALLGRCTLRINKIFELLLIAARFDYLSYSVINLYWGALFMFVAKIPKYAVLFGTFNYWVKFVDFYLLDAMCDLLTQYRSCAFHAASEVKWFKELNGFLLYANSSKSELWVCGLFTLNRSRWFKTLGSIVSFSVLLLQFHLLMKKNFAL